MLQNFQFKVSEVKINTELLDTILSEHLIQEGFKGNREIMILPNQAQHSSFACFGHCFSKGLSTIFNSPHRSISLSPPPKTKFSRLLTSFNHFSCVATLLSYSFRERLFEVLFLLVHAIRKIRIILPQPQHEAQQQCLPCRPSSRPSHLMRFLEGLFTFFNSPHRRSVHHVEKLQVWSLLEYIVDELSSK